jgi:hypothetical protein
MPDRRLSLLDRIIDMAAAGFIAAVILGVIAATVWRIWQAIP